MPETIVHTKTPRLPLGANATSLNNRSIPIEYTHKYCLTVTPNRRDKVYYALDIDNVINELISEYGFIITHKSFEMKKNKILHCHLAIASPVRLYPYPTKKGWQLYFERNPTEKWYNYLKKESQCPISQSMVLALHYFHHNYGFR